MQHTAFNEEILHTMQHAERRCNKCAMGILQCTELCNLTKRNSNMWSTQEWHRRQTILWDTRSTDTQYEGVDM